MKKSLWLTFFITASLLDFGQASKTKTPSNNNTLLWRISGNGLEKPSYLFGTMHMLCADDVQLSDSLKNAIKNSDKVYLEVDMTDMMQMMGAMAHMNMRDDTTLADLLSKEDYTKVKNYFEKENAMLPFSMIERYKPLLVESLIMEQMPQCDNTIIMEQLVMEQAKQNDKDIKGLETMDFQLSIFDSIPYKLQAKQLVKMVDDAGKHVDDKELQELTDAYKKQELSKLGDLSEKEDIDMQGYADLLIYNRNMNWVKKLQGIMAKGPVVVAVGAGHLPGDKGVINLLRKAGYKVEPVRNDMTKKKGKEI